MRESIRKVGAALSRMIGIDEALLLLGLLLLAYGLWLFWQPAAFLVPGGILIWLVLPSRAPFISRSEARNHGIRKR